MAPVVIPGINVALLWVLGYMWSYALWGVLVVQVYLYSEMFPKDRAGIKAVVWSMFLIETLCNVYLIYPTRDAAYGHLLLTFYL
ncbi:hypothetical protein C8R46DRAFT_1105856 [Mycena filopes]|nr:hypothetical protein C8R46DRAFT_1105856 [Mycena filopes]